MHVGQRRVSSASGLLHIGQLGIVNVPMVLPLAAYALTTAGAAICQSA